MKLNYDIEVLKSIRAKHKSEKITLCHGVFNYLHAGHIKHLQWAKQQADILVVSITGDDYLDNRRECFCLPEKHRCELIDNLKFVDYVVIAKCEDAIPVLGSLSPDLYVKGDEYISNLTEALQHEKNYAKRLLFSDTPKMVSSEELLCEITEAIDIYTDTERIDCILYCLARYKFIARLLHPQETVLDVGCGYGYGTKLLSKYCTKSVGCDINAICIEAARERFKDTDFIHADVCHLNEEYDVVVCMELIEHLDNVSSIIEKVKELARKYVVFSTPRYLPYRERSKVRQLFHIREYDYKSLYELFSEHFKTVLIFTQTDEIVSSGNPDVTWTYVAICYDN